MHSILRSIFQLGQDYKEGVYMCSSYRNIPVCMSIRINDQARNVHDQW